MAKEDGRRLSSDAQHERRKPVLRLHKRGHSRSEIACRAKEEGAEIHWGDETALVNPDVRGRGYAPKGQTPVAYAPAKREKLSMISTITNQGKTRGMIVDGSFDADRLIEFREALVKDAAKKVFLILDNLRVPHSNPVKEWLATRKEQIEVFYLPSYRHERNSDERLHADLKYGIASKVAVRSKANFRPRQTII
jgi:hypothetical protein